MLDDDLRPATVGVVGKLARRGHVPVGYYKDPEKTAATFPVIDGVRWSVPGDHARIEADGTITVLGRGSVSINTGGEKVYPEEVESALKSHADVFDAVVVGVPDERWGERVVAVVQPRPGRGITLDELAAHVHGHVAPLQGAARPRARRRGRALAVGQARLPVGAWPRAGRARTRQIFCTTLTPSPIGSRTTLTRSSATTASLSARIALDALVVVRRVEHTTSLEHVVEEDEPAGTEPQQDLLVVRGVAGLVGVDEGEVELLLGRQRPQGVDARTDPQVDAIGDPGLLPGFARNGGPLLAHVAAEQPAFRPHPARHRERGVPGEGTDLDGVARAHGAHEHLHEHRLVVADLHRNRPTGAFLGDGLQVALHRVGPGRVLGRVRVDRGIGELRAVS